MVLGVAECLGIQHVAPTNRPMATCSVSPSSPLTPLRGAQPCAWLSPCNCPGGGTIPKVSFWEARLWTQSISWHLPSSLVFAGSSPELALSVSFPFPNSVHALQILGRSFSIPFSFRAQPRVSGLAHFSPTISSAVPLMGTSLAAGVRVGVTAPSTAPGSE